MDTSPPVIFLQWHGDDDSGNDSKVDHTDVTWCQDRIFKNDVEYVRADLVARRKSGTQTFGTAAHKLHRGVPDTSVDAAHLVDTTALEKTVLRIIAQYPDGIISDDVRRRLSSLSYSSVTARYRSLLDKGYIIDTGLRAAGSSGRQQRIMKVTPEGLAAIDIRYRRNIA